MKAAAHMTMTAGDALSPAEVSRRYREGHRDFRDFDIREHHDDGVPFAGAGLEEADFSRARVRADFSGARLAGVSFRFADVRSCTFHDADLRGADFREADIEPDSFTGANLDCAKFD